LDKAAWLNPKTFTSDIITIKIGMNMIFRFLNIWQRSITRLIQNMEKFMISIYSSISLVLSLLVMSCGSHAKDDSPVRDSPHTIAVSGAGSKIYLTDREGQSSIQIPNVTGDYLAWSPDGKKLAFREKYDDRKTWSIHTMNSDGTNWKRLTHETDKWDSVPAWSPDGKKLLLQENIRIRKAFFRQKFG